MRKKLTFLFFAAGATLALSSCSGIKEVPLNYSEIDQIIETDWSDYSVPATGIVFADGQQSIQLKKGDTYTYDATLSPSKATLASVGWESSDSTVVSVNNGTVTAEGAGEAVITVFSKEEVFEPIELAVTVVVPVKHIHVEPANLELDFNQEARLLVTYEPTDTTYKDVTFTSSNEDVVVVNSEGHVTAKNLGIGEEANATITVASPYLDDEEAVVVPVHVIDKTVHVSAVKVFDGDDEVSSIRIEAGKALQLTGKVVPAEATYPDIQWVSSNASVAAVNSDGLVSALVPETVPVEDLEVTVSARAENNKHKDITVKVFEVAPHDIVVNNDVTLDTVNVTAVPLDLVYRDNAGDEITPSAPSPRFVSANEEVAKVVSDGDEGYHIQAVAKGDTTITVSDARYGVAAAEIAVHVVKGAEGIKFKDAYDNELPSTKKILPNDEFIVKAEVIPADAELRDVSFSLTSSDGNVTMDELVGVENAVIISAGPNTGNAVLQAELGSIKKTLNINVNDDPEPFVSGSAYIVGFDDTHNSGFGEHTKPSWDDSRYAFKFENKTENPYAQYEWVGTLLFNAGDEWKIRNGNSYVEILGTATDDQGTHQIGRYKIDEGAFASGEMQALTDANGSYTNVRVNEGGFYDVYYAYYLNEETPAEGWYEVYVASHNLTVNKTSTTVILNEKQTIKASNWNGELHVSSADEEIVEVESVSKEGLITIKGLALTDGVILTISDDSYRDPIEVTVKVVNEVVNDGYFVKGSFNGWEEDIDFVLTVNPEDANNYSLLDVELSAGDKLKVFNKNGATEAEQWITNDHDWEGCWFTLDDEGNLVVTTSGIYDIYFNIVPTYDDGNHIILSKHTVASQTFFLIGSFNSWTPSDANFALVGDSADSNMYVIEGVEFASGEEFKIFNAAGANDNERYITNGHTYPDCGFDLAENGNIIVSEAGEYKVKYFVNSEDDNHVVIEKAGEFVPDEPASNGYYLVGSKTSFKFEGAPKMNDVVGDNIAELYSYEAKENESIKVRGFFKGEDPESKWSFYAGAAQEFGEADNQGNFVFSKDVTVNIFAKWENSELKFYIAESGDDPVVSVKYYVLFGDNVEDKIELESQVLSQEEKDAGKLAKFSAELDVVAGTHFSFYEEDNMLFNNIGPNGDNVTDEIYNNWTGNDVNDWAIQASGEDKLVELNIYAGGCSFWIAGGNSAEHGGSVPEPDVPANNGYYLCGSKTDFKFAGAPKMNDVVGDNIAELYNYEAEQGESIKVRAYFKDENPETVWSFYAGAAQEFGEADDLGNFVFGEDVTVNIYAKWENSELKFYVAKVENPDPVDPVDPVTTKIYFNNGGSSLWGTVRPETSKLIYFTNDQGWDEVNAYAFNNGTATGKTAWPGEGAELAGYNEYSQPVYCYEVDTASYDYIIFNNGSTQTEDIRIDNVNDCTGFYISGWSGEGKGVVTSYKFAEERATDPIIYAWVWEDGQVGRWVALSASTEFDGYTLELVVNENETNIIFARCAYVPTSLDGSELQSVYLVWNKTADLDIPGDGYGFVIVDWNSGNWSVNPLGIA